MTSDVTQCPPQIHGYNVPLRYMDTMSPSDTWIQCPPQIHGYNVPLRYMDTMSPSDTWIQCPPQIHGYNVPLRYMDTMSPSDTWICRAVSPAHCAPDSCCRGSPRFYPDEQQVLLSPRVWRSPHKTTSAEFEKGCVTGLLVNSIHCVSHTYSYRLVAYPVKLVDYLT